MASVAPARGPWRSRTAATIAIACVIAAAAIPGSALGEEQRLAAAVSAASVDGVVCSASGSVPVSGATLEIWRSGTSGWQLETTVIADVDGWWSYPTDDLGPVRVRAVDPTGMHDAVWYNGALGLASATDIGPGVAESAFVPIEMRLARPATVRGTVRSSVTGAPIAGVRVQLCTAIDGLVAFETMTGAGGAYAFSAVPPSTYIVAFEDPSARYSDACWHSSGAEAATPISVAAAVQTVADAALVPIQTDVPVFTSAYYPYGTDQYQGQIGTLRGELKNGLTGLPLAGKRVVLQTSANGLTGWSDTGLIASDRGSGVYEVDILLDRPGVYHYRLVVPATEFSTQAVTSSRELRVGYFAIDLYGFRVEGGTWTGSIVRAPATGALVRVWAIAGSIGSDTLRTFSSNFVLQRSVDGRTWVDDPGVTVGVNVLEVSAMVPATPGLVRIALRAPRFAQLSVTSSAQFYRPTSVSITRSTSSVAYPRPFVLQGQLTPGSIGDSCVVEVRKPGSSRWSYSSARLAYAAVGSASKWWYRYTPRLRGTYTFRVRFAGDATRIACTSGTVTVRVR